MNSHEEIKALLAVYDSLSRTKRTSVDQHVQSCPSCQVQLAAYQKMDDGLGRLVDPRPNATFRSEFHARLEAERPRQNSFWSAFPPFFKQLSAQTAQVGALIFIAVVVFSMWLALRSRPEQPAAVPFLPTATPQPTTTSTPESTAAPTIVNTITPTGTPEPVWTIEQQSSFSGQLNVVRAVTIGQDGRLIAAAGSSFNAVLWESAGSRNQYQQTFQEEVAYGASLNALALSEDYLAVGGASGSEGLVSVLNLSSGEEIYALPSTIPPIKSVAFSNSGKVIAIGTEPSPGAQNGAVYLWFLNYSDRLYELAFEGDTVTGLAFSPDDEFVAAVSASGIRLWQVTSNDVFQTLTAEEGQAPVFSSLAFGPDGQSIAAGTREGMLYVWDIASGQILQKLDTNSRPLESLAFSADGRQLAAVSSRGEVTVWGLAGDEPELLFNGQTAERTGLATDVIFIDRTVLVVVGMADGQVQVWLAAPSGN